MSDNFFLQTDAPVSVVKEAFEKEPFFQEIYFEGDEGFDFFARGRKPVQCIYDVSNNGNCWDTLITVREGEYELHKEIFQVLKKLPYKCTWIDPEDDAEQEFIPENALPPIPV